MSDNTNVEYLKLLFEEWRYRHQNYWGFVYRWFIAIAAILAAPLITPAFHDDTGGLVAVFSAIALFFAYIAKNHLLHELALMTVVRKIYNEAHPAHMDENVIDLYKEIAPDMPNLIFFSTSIIIIIEVIGYGMYYNNAPLFQNRNIAVFVGIVLVISILIWQRFSDRRRGAVSNE